MIEETILDRVVHAAPLAIMRGASVELDSHQTELDRTRILTRMAVLCTR